MAYLRLGRGFKDAGYAGCGPGCGCAPCKGQERGLSERYVPEEEEEEPDPPAASAGRPVAPVPNGDVGGWGGGFAADVQAQDPRSGARCQASERRIRPVVEPPASELV